MFNGDVGGYLPWYNQDTIDFLDGSRDRLKNYHVFEYGIGFSTLYYAQFVLSLTGVELRREWYDKINSILQNDNINGNINLHLVSKNFAGSINDVFVPKLDVNKQNNIFIVIDSNDRALCLATSAKLARIGNVNAVIMLDNSERPNLQAPINELIANGFYTKTFTSTRPLDGKVSTSTFFCLNSGFFASK